MQDFTDGKLTLASYFLDVGNPDKALQTLDEVDESVLDEPEYWIIRGSALYELKQFGKASRAVLKGLNLDPEDIQLLYMLSSAYQMQGNLASAEKAVLQALDISPENPPLLSKYAELVASAGQFDKADQLLGEASLIEPEDEAVVRTRYVVAMLKGNDRETRHYGEKMIARDPENPNVLIATGADLISHGQVGKGYDRLRRAARSGPSIIEEFKPIFQEGRLINHWLLVPLWPIERFGPAVMWISEMVVTFGLRLMGFTTIAGILAITYVAFAIYSWVAPPLVRRFLFRRYR